MSIQQRLASKFSRLNHALSNQHTWSVEGRVTRIIGMTIEAVGVRAALGSRCLIQTNSGYDVEAEVVGFTENITYLMCCEKADNIAPNARIITTGNVARVPVGPQLLGRIIDAACQPLDNLGPLNAQLFYPLTSKPINPLSRAKITEPLDVGVRAINGLLTVGRGQRMGLFAGSGVGKSVLLSMMTKFTSADIIVVGLIGERGREVKEFIEDNLGAEGLARSVIVASPADQSPLMRLHGARVTTSIAEYFRDQGKQVLLLMDSLTRFAQAQREIALAVGEPPATKGYPPSVFTVLPELIERAGNAKLGQGSITAFYTVLVEGDDQQDPIADSARAILDGHIVLSRRLTEAGHYPAIDIEASISRVMQNISQDEHFNNARVFKAHLSQYQRNRDLIAIGAYTQGSDPAIDEAIRLYPMLEHYLQQGMNEQADLASSINGLDSLFKPLVKV